jgi:hypothetical protein
VKVRLIRETPQHDASTPAPVPPVGQADPGSPTRRVKRSWDEVLAKFAVPENKPEKDSEKN